ncbi:MAG: Ig-like domain-containing protein, partial [Longimicrobiales bacterium]
MRSPRILLARLLVVVAIGSCVGNDGPTAVPDQAVIALQPALIPSPADASALPINRIRTVVSRAADGALLREQQFEVSPSATSWSIDLDVPAGSSPIDVIVYLSLIHVASDGTEAVQFSGRTPAASVMAGDRVTGLDADIVRGPLANLFVTGLTLGTVPDTLFVGISGPLSAGATTSGATPPTIFWTALDPAVVAVVDSTATGLAPGIGRVVASAGAHADTASIVVIVPPVDSVRVLPDSADVVAGSTRTYAVELRDGSGNLLTGRTLFWSTGNSAVATVTQAGLVNGVAPGVSTVRVTSEGVFDDAIVRVTAAPIPVASVLVSPDSAVVQAGNTTAFTAQTFDGQGNLLTGRVVTWTTGSGAIATVGASTGTVTGVAAGTTTVRATSEGIFDDGSVRVTAAPTGSGGTNSWLGGSGNWSDPSKWSQGRVPLPTDSVAIAAIGPYTVTFDVNDSIAYLLLGGPTGTSTLAMGTGRVLTVLNGAAIDVLTSGRLEMADATINAGLLVNQGTVRTTGLAVFQADVETLGHWEVAAGAQFFQPVVGGDFVNGGVLTIAASAVLNFPSNGVLDMWVGSLVGDGFLNLGSGSSLQLGQDLAIDGPHIVLNDAELEYFGVPRRLTIGPQSSLQLLSQLGQVRVTPKIDVLGTLVASGPQIVGQDSLFVRAAGNMLLDGTGGTNYQTAAVENFGTVFISGSDSVRIGPGANPQSIVNRPSGVIQIAPGVSAIFDGTLLNQGEISILGAAKLLRESATGTPIDADHVNEGLVTLIDGASLDVRLGGSSPTFTNSGTLDVQASTLLSVTNLSGGFIDNTSTGIIGGGGTVDVRAGVPTGVNNGTIAPGSSPGILTWMGAVPMGPTGRIAIELEGLAAGAEYDRLDASFDLVLNGNGTLDVTAPGLTPVDGDEFAVLTFAQRQGNFAAVNVPTFPGVTLDTVWAEAGTTDTLYLVATSTSPAPPNLNRWTGAVSTAWGTAGNWSKNAVPVASDSVVIDLAGTPVVTLSASTTIAHLKLGRAGSAPSLVMGGSGHTLTVTGTVINRGFVSFQDIVTNSIPMVLSAAGGFTNVGGATVAAQGNAETPQLLGQLSNEGVIWTHFQSLILAAPPSVSHVNTGVIHAENGDISIDMTAGTSSLFNTGRIEVRNGRTIVVQGGTLTNGSAGMIAGEGTLTMAGVAFANDGRIEPGFGTGILTITGAANWGATAQLGIGIGGLTPGAYDQLLGNGALSLDGTLNVTSFGFTPTDGDRFAVMTFASRSGNFATVNLPTVPGIVFDTVWAEAGAVDTLFIEATAAPTIPLGAVIGSVGTDADAVDAPGNPVNLVGTALNGGATTLAAGGGTLPTADFNALGGLDRTTGFDRGDLLAVRADQKHTGAALLLDLDGDGTFTDEVAQPGFGMHANRFITFDLDVIRANASLPASQAFTLSGYSGPAEGFPTSGMSLVVLLDGLPVVLHDVGTVASAAQPFGVAV